MEIKTIIEEKLHEYAEGYFNANCGKQEIESMAEDIYNSIMVVLPQANVMRRVNHCEECSKELESGTVFCTADCRRHYYSD